LPLELPYVETYKPGPEGEGPLANIDEWTAKNLETNTMPGYAGSSWYFLRYMDPDNQKEFCDRKASDYWGQVDLYIGGTEHAVGHLLYSRMWTKALYDLGYIGHDEPYKRLVNQGMIQGSSRFVYRVQIKSAMAPDHVSKYSKEVFVSKDIINKTIGDFKWDNNFYLINAEKRDKLYSTIKKQVVDFPEFDNDEPLQSLSIQELHVDVNIVDGVELDIDKFREWRSGEHANAEFVLEDDKYICGTEVEKMSKSKFNTVNPDDLVWDYGSDTFRMYEMFLGPVEMSKPWDTKGIEGVHRFLKKLWRLFFKEPNSPSFGGGKGEAVWTDEPPSEAELKALHKTIKQIEEVTERFSFNTGVSGFMIAVNELTDLKCHKKAILEKLVILLSPYAPHIAEELWSKLGNSGSVLDQGYPVYDPKYLVESSKEYPISINGKMRTTIDIALGIPEKEVEKIVLENEVVKKWLEGKQPRKIIYKEGKMVNVVV